MESEAKSYEGSCHCGAVRYRVNLDVNQAITCNCSICSRTGTILAFGPGAALELLAGEEALKDYQFGRKSIHHLFCSTCGIRTFGRGEDPEGNPVVAVNLRCLEGLDLEELRPTHVDGKSL